MSLSQQRRSPAWWMLAVGLAGAFVVGCQTMSPSLVTCPMPNVEQAARIQDIVPLGTPRDETVSRLKKAGIGGSFGTARSIFYCQTWTRNEAERWQIDVELLFDEHGKLYAFRPDPQGRATPTNEEPVVEATKKPKDNAATRQAGLTDPFAE